MAEGNQTFYWQRRLLPWIFVACGAALVVILWSGVQRGERGSIDERTRIITDQVGLRLEHWIETRATAVELAALYLGQEEFPGVSFPAAAELMLTVFPGFQAFNFVDAQGVIREVHPREGNEAALGRSLAEHSHPGIREALRMAAGTGELAAGPVTQLYQGGTGLVTYKPILDRSGALRGYVNGVFRIADLVDGCLAEESLRSRHCFRLVDAEGQVVYLHAPAEATGKWPHAASTALGVIDQTWHLELAPTRAYVNSLSGWTDEILAGLGLALVFMFAILMANHYRSLDRLGEQQARYRLLVENVRDMIVRFDGKGRFTYASPSYCEVFGLTESELLGRDFMPLVHEDDRGETRRQMTLLQKPPHAIYLEQRAMTRHGWRWLSWSQTAMVDRDGAVESIIGVGRDITARKELEEQLRQAQKLQAVGQLAGGIAHDFNNILQAILGNLEFVRDDLPEDHPSQPDLALVQQSARRAGDLTRQLLAFGRQQLLEPRNLDLNELVANILKLLRRVLGESIEVEFHQAEGLPPVLADPGQLEQVLMNLCVNARDAVGRSGRIIITTRLREVTEANEEAGIAAGSYLVIEVADDGKGMDDATLARIFDPFYTTKEQGRGTGLGLATVYGIVRQHGGFVEARSTLGAGSVFAVHLPRSEKAVPDEPTPSVGTPVGGDETILLAEDDDQVRDFATRALETVGYTVIAARDGLEAVARAEEHAGNLDLALLDVIMPGLDGPDAALRIREFAPRIGVVLASGYAPDESMVTDGLQGESRFLSKPYHVRTLLFAVRDALDRR